MANDLDDSPFKIDTPGTIYTGRLKINEMVWKGPDRADENLVVTDSNGRTLWDETSLEGGRGISYRQPFNQQCDGIAVITIDSGVLYIYCSNFIIL